MCYSVSTMPTVNINQIKSVVEKFEELQELVQAVYPGYTVVITSEENGIVSDSLPLVPGGVARMNDASFKTLSGVKQIAQIMKERGKPIPKKVLLTELQRRGSKVGKDTLTSYLSREPIFVPASRGVWTLKKLLEKEGGV